MLLVSFKRYVSVSVISHNITAQGAKNGRRGREMIRSILNRGNNDPEVRGSKGGRVK